jgi:hypothetical protein
VASLAGESAAARLIGAGMRVDLSGVAGVLIPHRSAPLPNIDVAWVQELGAYPVRQGLLASTLLGPTRKLITGIVVTRELADYANGDEIIGSMLREDVAASLDFSLFSNAAASASRPAGILNGVTSLAATTGSGEAALRGDIAKLEAIATATGTNEIAYIASPSYAARAATYANVVGNDVNVWPSVAVADGVLIAIAPAAFVSGFGAVPKINTAQDATLHRDDASPQQIGTPGSPNVVAAPTRSMFQTDSIALRLILDCAWSLRSTGAVSWITGATW